MSKPTQKQIAKTLLDPYDKTFAEEIGMRLVDALTRPDVKGDREELLRSV